MESVWDYPRPPSLDPSGEHVVVEFGGLVVADTRAPVRVLETSHPPTYYLPMDDVDLTAFADAAGTSWCEFKGRARYFDLVVGDGVSPSAAWYYPSPTPRYERLHRHVAIYPGRVDRCTVDGETVQAQEGDFYGGWITSRVVGPFKGAPGTLGW
ncbi:DUF427 domain-containing protein [Spongisporangium articulatum]|uniref:DUF427 domain-containing protein n=1 Tax=Spongisporangium articulatum TaxID=3362603 RepID=A0ABW8AGK4_9ACTN